MLVYKFGGASVSSANAIRNLAVIAGSCRNDLFIVVSAFGKTTNSLERLLDCWFEGREEKFIIFREISDYHDLIINELFTENRNGVQSVIAEITSAIEDKLYSSPGGNYDYEYDQLVSYGELISTKIISLYLNEQGFKNRWIDAREWLITDNVYREANVDFIRTGVELKRLIDPDEHRVYLTQGFIGATAEGLTTTLGREGSDYTAAIIAYLLDASELVVWKDVPGILTADPSVYPDAEKLENISYQEAIELSFYGAKVIHPKTIKPLQNKNIPLYVKSFIDPEGGGTLIQNINHPVSLKPILIVKQDQLLVSLTPLDFSFVVEDCLSRIFAIFFNYRMKVNLIQHSAISFTLCLDNRGPYLKKLLNDLQGGFRVLYNENLELITIRHYDQYAIEKHTAGREILVEQRSRSTAMLVVRKPVRSS